MDIYFLLDMSNSMSKTLRDLVSASKEVAENIEKLTPDFTIGFGSYSDKPTFPFAKEESDYKYVESVSDKKDFEIL